MLISKAVTKVREQEFMTIAKKLNMKLINITPKPKENCVTNGWIPCPKTQLINKAVY